MHARIFQLAKEAPKKEPLESSKKETLIGQTIQEYCEVYIKDNFDSLLESANPQKLQDIKKLIEAAIPLTSIEYATKIKQHYSNNKIAEAILEYYKRVVSGNLTQDDDLIIALSKIDNSINLEMLKKIISDKVSGFSQNYFAEKNASDRQLSKKPKQ